MRDASGHARHVPDGRGTTPASWPADAQNPSGERKETGRAVQHRRIASHLCGRQVGILAETLRIAVMASGRGSNFTAISDAVKAGRLDAEVIALVCDKEGAPVIQKAVEAGVPNVVLLPRKGFASRADYDHALTELVAGFAPDIVALAGFMRVLGPEFVERFRGKIVNIHPSLLPSFPGLDAQRQALEYGVKVSGCTVHFVDEGTDTGPIILQRAVPVLEGDDEDALSARILEQEHILYVEALGLISRGLVRIDGRRTKIEGGRG